MIQTAAQGPESPLSRIFVVYEPTYWRGMVCTLGSLLRHTRTPLRVDVLVQERNTRHLDQKLCLVRPQLSAGQSLEIVPMPEDVVAFCDRLPLKAHFKPEACYRLFYFDVCDVSTDVLYLDIDLIVTADLSGAFPSAGPLDLIEARATPLPEASKRVIGTLPRYFNSGVIKFMSRDHGPAITDRLRRGQAMLSDLAARCFYLDQDVLNLVFDGAWTGLPRSLNHTTSDERWGTGEVPTILHATGSRKPWFPGGGHPFTTIYNEEMRTLGLGWLQSQQFDWPIKAAKRRALRAFPILANA
jgi:lipopolysaccharide biosynthesis glycosyltransferase